MRPGGKLWISNNTVGAVYIYACPSGEFSFPFGFDRYFATENGMDDVSWVDVLVARILVLVLIFVLTVAPIVLAYGFRGIALGGLLCVVAFEDTTLFRCVVGFGMELAWTFYGFVVVLLIVTTTSESLDCVDFMVVVTMSFTPEFIMVVAAPVTSFFEVPIIIMARIAIIKPSTVVAIIISSGSVIVLLAPSDVFSD